MSKSKKHGTGEGFLGEIMVHRITRAVGVVENVIEAQNGWPPQITLKLPDGSQKKRQAQRFPRPHCHRAQDDLAGVSLQAASKRRVNSM